MINKDTFTDPVFWNNILSLQHCPFYFIRSFFESIERTNRDKVGYHDKVHLWYIEDLEDGDSCFIATTDERDPSDLVRSWPYRGNDLDDRYSINRLGASFYVHSSEEIVSEVFKFLSEIDYKLD